MGAKKKSLANRLAKMSDEERARYLQHKADMEEEVKRRKEQLIATFMKVLHISVALMQKLMFLLLLE